MRTLKLTVAYDGTNYHGFQKQTNALTVQQVLEEKLSLLCGEKIVTAGSGRTDTGVHARGQVVSLTTSGSIPLENLLKACAGILPISTGTPKRGIALHIFRRASTTSRN